MQDKNEAYKCFERRNSNSQYFEYFQSLQNLLGVSIEASKERYYSRLCKKLMESSTSPKKYSSVLKSFHNNKKITCIPPIFRKNRFVTNFKEKAKKEDISCKYLKNWEFWLVPLIYKRLAKEKWRHQIPDYDILFMISGWLVDKSNRPLPFVNQEKDGGEPLP